MVLLDVERAGDFPGPGGHPDGDQEPDAAAAPREGPAEEPDDPRRELVRNC